VVRLRRADSAGPGFSRRRRGRGFTYTDSDGSRLTDPAALARIEALAIPPAWREVWICPWPNGHIQATGTDAAGRRQYRYHDEWRRQRDGVKHDHVLEVARRLPMARETVAAHLAQRGYPRERVLACAFRLLDLGFFRIGGETYAEENQTFGLATLRPEHVTVRRDVVTFDYVAKGSKERVQSIIDPEVARIIRGLRASATGQQELLCYKTGRTWRDVKSADVNDYLREVVGTEVSAKDFRTWHATVLMAIALAVSADAPMTTSARKRAVVRAVKEVADYLGNTPAVCRASYIDPRIIDLYDDGVTIRAALERLGDDTDFGAPATHGHVEAAVLAMLAEPTRAKPAKHRRAATKAKPAITAPPVSRAS
jgi:DNA topoisomerase IB